MRGKHSNYLKYLLLLAYREKLRATIRNIVQWEPLKSPKPGCTAIIGVCSRLPDVLAANLRCLNASRWPSLKSVIAIVDGTESALPANFEQRLCEAYPDLNLRFLYYSPAQSALAEKVKLPYIYSWLSWCIGIKHVQTRYVLIHDYDALILGQTLNERFTRFAESNAKVQGISWYKVNGVEVDDRLATTFEAFFDTQWLRSLAPIDLFNKLRIKNRRSIDYDTTLDAQDRLLELEERTVMAMNQDELVHPSQMIHQYTMFRRQPGSALPCYSIPMIPFFAHLSGINGAVEHATRALQNSSKSSNIDLIGDGTHINLTQLQIEQVDWVLKQIVQVMVVLNLNPDPAIYHYGKALYGIVGTSDDLVWHGDFTETQRHWIQKSAEDSISKNMLWLGSR